MTTCNESFIYAIVPGNVCGLAPFGNPFAYIHTMQAPTFYCGTSGLVLPVPNKQAFPPEYRQSSRFTIKLWRGITHAPNLVAETAAVGRFLQAANGLGEKKGCLLVQLPPSAKLDKTGELKRLLECILTGDPRREWKLAVEFRHNSWYTPAIGQLLAQYHAAQVLQDMPASLSWQPAGNEDFIYLRYHGSSGDYKGGYDKRRLGADAMNIKGWLNAGKEVYVYFNNTIGDALSNVQELRTMVIDRPFPQPQ